MEADRHRNQDDGFTLPEVLIVIVVIGVLSTVIALVFSVIVRTAPATEARADDARSLLGLSQWIPADVASTPPGAIDISVGGRRADSGCSGAAQSDAGQDLLFLSWTGASANFRVVYRWAPSGDGFVVKRYGCRNGGSAQVNTLTSSLQPIAGNIPIQITPIPATGPAKGLIFTVNVVDPVTGQLRELLVLDALSRNIATDLAPVPTIGPPESTTSTTTTTTTTTVPPTTDPTDPTTTTSSTTSTTTTTVPCAVNSVSASPNPANRNNMNGDAARPLTSTVTVTISTNGNCAGLFLRYFPEATQGNQGAPRVVEFLGATSVELPNHNWRPKAAPGHPLEVRNTPEGPPLNTGYLVVN